MQIIHLPQSPWLITDGSDQFTIRVWSEPGKFSMLSLLYSDPYDYNPGLGKRLKQQTVDLSICARTEEYETWTCSIHMPTRKLEYQFMAHSDTKDEKLWYGPMGLRQEKEAAGSFRSGYRFDEDRAPSWTGTSVWYQIFPDRFAGGKENENFTPTTTNFWNGTLEGIMNRIPYLEETGITGVYLNPVFASPSNHRYDTLDYLQVDPRLGTNETLEKLAGELHRRRLRLMMDGVFNHCSWNSPYFQDVRTRGDDSPFREWFIIHDMNAVMTEPLERFTSERMKVNPPYESFAFAANMPKWNTDHPEVQEYLIGAAEEWTKRLELDAWRLDVPDEVSPAFLRAFRRRMREINPEILIIGEIWTDPSPWNQSGLFDGTMDYPLYNNLSRYMLQGELSARDFCMEMERRQGLLPMERQRNQMLFLGNHDIPRSLTVAKGNLARVQAAWLFLCLLDGEVNLYYGDEKAMQGGEDPANRGAMLWKETDEGQKMTLFMRQVHAFRKNILRVSANGMHFAALDEQCVQVTVCREHFQYVLLLNPRGFEEKDDSFKNGKKILEGSCFQLYCS